jgi:hypothetical protein
MLLADDAVRPGISLRIRPRISSSAPRSASVTGDFGRLEVDLQVLAAEERPDEVAAEAGELDHEGAVGIEVHTFLESANPAKDTKN